MELDQISAIPEWWSDTIDEVVDNASISVDLTDLFEDDGEGLDDLSAPVQGVIIRRGPLPWLWLSFKDIIIELYGKEGQNLKLWEVQNIMKQTYGFNASKKQYKDKFKDWGVRKNERRQAPAAPQRRRSSSTSAYTNVTVDSEAAEKGSIVVVPAATSSVRMLRGYRTLQNLVYYLESRLFSGGILHFFGPLHHWQPRSHTNITPSILCHPSQLNSNYSRAMVLTRNNCPKPALALFSHTSDVMETLFTGHHPALTPCILDAFIENVYESNPRSRSTMISQAIEAAERTLSPSHPITELCRLLQVPLDDEEEVDHLLWFCDRLCKVFSHRLGVTHRISIYVNLRYFEKLLQIQKFSLAQEHLENAVEPAFTALVARETVPEGMEAACLCYLRRKAHLLRALGKYGDATETLRQPISLIGSWLERLKTSIVGNPIVEETFRLLDEHAHLLHHLQDTSRAVDLHAFALELCIAVRGEHDGKTMRMVAGHAQFCRDAELYAQEAALKIRFPEVFAEANAREQPLTFHKLPCANCGNGQDTQNFCEAHRQLPEMTSGDRARIRLIRDRLESLR